MKCYLLVRHRVRDYGNWRIEFDSQISSRKENGERNFQVFTDENDQSWVTILSEWENLKGAKKFLSDPVVSEIMQTAGVMEQPSIYFLRK